nr:integrase, catalytic region, zinc finger, CCHC-type, peptidase aspartic, catalytic [Tanacetum cinerariifolium]
CYLLNDYEDVGKLKAKGDIGVFVGYLKESAAFRIYNKRTQEVGVPSSNTQSVSNNMVHNVDEASTSRNVFNERLEDAYFDASSSFHDLVQLQSRRIRYSTLVQSTLMWGILLSKIMLKKER